jgi:hypothetical protein
MLYYSAVGGKVIPQTQYALNFNGTNQSIQSSSVPQITAYNQVTFYFNFFYPVGGQGTLLQDGTASDSPTHFFSYSGTTFRTYNVSYFNYSGLVVNTYNQVTITRNFTTSIERVFINGVFVGSRTLAAKVLRPPYINIGYNPYQGFLKATLKEVSIASTIPTDAQIIADHAAKTSSVFDLLQLKTIYPPQTQNNPNTVVSTQGNVFSMINYPNPLVQGINLIQI